MGYVNKDFDKKKLKFHNFSDKNGSAVTRSKNRGMPQKKMLPPAEIFFWLENVGQLNG